MSEDKTKIQEHIDDLYATLLQLRTKKDLAEFFEDLCTVKEVEQMAERLTAAKLLMEGKTYVEVIEQAEISSATLSRVSKCVQYGKGYRKCKKD